jgi:hypothetical protein
MKSHEIQACSFSEWYPLFKKVTFPSKIIPLTQEFVDYLLADNLVLRSDQALLTYSRDDSSDSEDDEEGWAKAESETPALEVLILSVLVFLYFIILAFLGPTF